MVKPSIKMSELPQSLKVDIREKLVKRHASGLSSLGMFYIPKVHKANLTFTEKLLVSYYAYESALERGDFRVANELVGYCLFGFIDGGYYELADLLLTKVTDPNEGGTLQMTMASLINLRHMKTMYGKSLEVAEAEGKQGEVDAFITKVNEAVDLNLEGLFAFDKMLEHRAKKDRQEWYIYNVALPIVLAGLIVWSSKYWLPLLTTWFSSLY